MHALILQFVDPRQDDARPVFSHNLGVLAAMLAAEDIPCRLLALAGYQPQVLRRAVIEHRPRYVLAELNPYAVSAAHRTIVDLAERFSLPVAAIGPYATCRPAEAVSIPGVRALALGEYEAACVALLGAVRDAADPAGIDGLWCNSEDGLIKGRLPALVEDLDSLPFPDRDIFDYARIVRETGEIALKVARGCPKWCAHCLNDWYMDLYADRGAFVRRRSVANVLDELSSLVQRYQDARSVTFHDHCFATDTPWLGELAAGYPARCPLPYRCFVPLGEVTAERAALLRRSGCRWVHAHFGSGSRFIREEILSMPQSAEQIVTACRVLREADLSIAAEVFIGCPYESEITIEETLALVRRTEVTEIHPRVFYPTPGTRAAELCGENNWISGRGEDCYWRQQSVLDMPSMPADHIQAVMESFPRLLKSPGAASVRRLLKKVTRSRRRGIRSLLGR